MGTTVTAISYGGKEYSSTFLGHLSWGYRYEKGTSGVIENSGSIAFKDAEGVDHYFPISSGWGTEYKLEEFKLTLKNVSRSNEWSSGLFELYYGNTLINKFPTPPDGSTSGDSYSGSGGFDVYIPGVRISDGTTTSTGIWSNDIKGTIKLSMSGEMSMSTTKTEWEATWGNETKKSTAYVIGNSLTFSDGLRVELIKIDGNGAPTILSFKFSKNGEIFNTVTLDVSDTYDPARDKDGYGGSQSFAITGNGTFNIIYNG